VAWMGPQKHQKEGVEKKYIGSYESLRREARGCRSTYHGGASCPPKACLLTAQLHSSAQNLKGKRV
jgi:hypothetical protein